MKVLKWCDQIQHDWTVSKWRDLGKVFLKNPPSAWVTHMEIVALPKVKMWIFDTADGMSRYLQLAQTATSQKDSIKTACEHWKCKLGGRSPLRKGRCGCPGPARRLQFYGEGDRELIVGGGFQGHGFVSKISFIQEQQNQVPGMGFLIKIILKSIFRWRKWCWTWCDPQKMYREKPWDLLRLKNKESLLCKRTPAPQHVWQTPRRLTT